jgi:hypothetical protein
MAMITVDTAELRKRSASDDQQVTKRSAESVRRRKSDAAKTKKPNKEGNSSCELLPLHEQID